MPSCSYLFRPLTRVVIHRRNASRRMSALSGPLRRIPPALPRRACAAETAWASGGPAQEDAHDWRASTDRSNPFTISHTASTISCSPMGTPATTAFTREESAGSRLWTNSLGARLATGITTTFSFRSGGAATTGTPLHHRLGVAAADGDHGGLPRAAGWPAGRKRTNRPPDLPP